MYGYESWTIKKAEHWRNGAFELLLLLITFNFNNFSNCVGEDSWEFLDCKEIQPDNPKENQPWVLIGRTDSEAPILWPPDVKIWLIRKDPEAGKDWRQKKNGMTEDEMVGRHHWFNGYEFEPALGDGEGQGSLACCSPWGHRELDSTEWLNNNNITIHKETKVPNTQRKNIKND